jgi:hypothetical protein
VGSSGAGGGGVGAGGTVSVGIRLGSSEPIVVALGIENSLEGDGGSTTIAIPCGITGGAIRSFGWTSGILMILGFAVEGTILTMSSLIDIGIGRENISELERADVWINGRSTIAVSARICRVSEAEMVQCFFVECPEHDSNNEDSSIVPPVYC